MDYIKGIACSILLGFGSLVIIFICVFSISGLVGQYIEFNKELLHHCLILWGTFSFYWFLSFLTYKFG